jgi:hypothetical protein
MAEEEQSPEAMDRERWIRLEAHASAMMGLLNALMQSAADREGRVPADLAALYEAFEPVWRAIQSRLFPD